MINPAQKTPRELSIEKGRDIVIGFITLLLLLEGVGLFFKLDGGQIITIVDVIRVVSTATLCVYLYKGHNWAKTLLALFMGISTIRSVATLCRITMISFTNFSHFAVVLLLAVVSAVSTYYLIFSNDIDEFLNSRKI